LPIVLRLSLRPQQAATESIDIELSALLKIVVLRMPPAFIVRLSPQHAELATRGRQLKEQLPCPGTAAYLGPRKLSL
jgi:hypothetical protein